MRLRLFGVLFVIFVLTLSAGVGKAGASTLTFEGLSSNPCCDLIPSGYGGLNWSNMGVINGFTYAGGTSGYRNGLISGSYVAFNESGGQGDALDITATGTFDFDSTYLTAAWNDGLSIQVRGYNNGVLLYDNTLVVDTAASTLFTFDYLGIDDLRFNSFGGVNHGYPGAGTQFAMDNFTFNERTSVPEPCSLLLLCTGLAGLAGCRWRKARTQA